MPIKKVFKVQFSAIPEQMTPMSQLLVNQTPTATNCESDWLYFFNGYYSFSWVFCKY